VAEQRIERELRHAVSRGDRLVRQERFFEVEGVQNGVPRRSGDEGRGLGICENRGARQRIEDRKERGEVLFIETIRLRGDSPLLNDRSVIVADGDEEDGARRKREQEPATSLERADQDGADGGQRDAKA